MAPAWPRAVMLGPTRPPVSCSGRRRMIVGTSLGPAIARFLSTRVIVVAEEHDRRLGRRERRKAGRGRLVGRDARGEGAARGGPLRIEPGLDAADDLRGAVAVL